MLPLQNVTILWLAVILDARKDDQIQSGVDHAHVSAQGVATAEEGAREPIADGRYAQSSVRRLLETMRGIVMRRDELDAVSLRLSTRV